MKLHLPLSTFLAALMAPVLVAQQTPPKSDPVALPEPVTPAPASAAPVPGLPGAPVQPEKPAVTDTNPPLPEKAPAAPVLPAAAPADAVSVPASPRTKVTGGIVLNFQGASLGDVLNYLSEAAGFVIVQEAQVSGTVNVVSRQPISPDEAVDLVNAVLLEKGYVAIRNGRILKIVSRSGAQKRDLPVRTGSDPDQIPAKDEMITQILPLRYGEAAKLVENLRPLLPDSATISANESSNAILMTDTQTNIRRIAQIIRAIDTSVASISTIQVYPLEFADAKELASVITQLFANSTGGAQNNRGRGRGFGGFGGGGFPFGGGGGGGGGDNNSGQSEARQANQRVIAVADEQSNSLIVSAPEEDIPRITELVNKIDTSIVDVTDSRIFRLLHADAVELADIITNLFSDSTTQNNQGRNGNNQGRGFGRFGGFGGNRGGQANNGAQQSQRSLLQSKVVAVGDPRTNSLIVNAARDSMTQIAEMVGRLDSTDAKKQRVYVHSLEYSDADSVANVLRGMLGDTTAITNTQQSGAGRLNERSANGAAMDTTQFSNSSGGRAIR